MLLEWLLSHEDVFFFFWRFSFFDMFIYFVPVGRKECFDDTIYIGCEKKEYDNNTNEYYFYHGISGYSHLISQIHQEKRNPENNDYIYKKPEMKKEVYGQGDVAAVLNQDFVPAMVDTDRRPDLKAAYGVEGLPTIWFLTSAGEGITYIPGYVDAPTFRKILQWVATGAYAEQSFEEFTAVEG